MNFTIIYFYYKRKELSDYNEITEVEFIFSKKLQRKMNFIRLVLKVLSNNIHSIYGGTKNGDKNSEIIKFINYKTLR